LDVAGMLVVTPRELQYAMLFGFIWFERLFAPARDALRPFIVASSAGRRFGHDDGLGLIEGPVSTMGWPKFLGGRVGGNRGAA
jgi:hypothetical protein